MTGKSMRKSVLWLMTAVIMISAVMTMGCSLRKDNTEERSPSQDMDIPKALGNYSEEPGTYSPVPEEAVKMLDAFTELVVWNDPPPDDTLVRVRDYIPGIHVELAYATENNFTGKVIYDFDEAYLRFGTVKKLVKVQQALEAEGLSLLIWDAARPTYAQYRLYEVTPNANYVANPNRGYSTHSRGNTVDITICDSDGNPVVMPSGFDNFTALADRNYRDVSKEAADNSEKLTSLMKANGFTTIASEWWHFADVKSYNVIKDSEFDEVK